MLDPTSILRLHDASTLHGHTPSSPAPRPATPLEVLILQQHVSNFALWHEEDRARDPSATDTVIARVKRDIDRFNQQRNDLVEQIDSMLVAAASQNAAAPLHSETPGMMIDRLSVLALKIFHTEAETRRSTFEHQTRNRERLQTLIVQRFDLANCLDRLWSEVLAGTRRFKLYRQMKMYNDPTLNPAIYNAMTATES